VIILIAKYIIAAKYKGFTLVEVILSMALLGLIVSLAFSLFFFGLNTFGLGEKQADVQFDVRMASQFISHEVRYAKEVEILNSLPATLDNSFYIYVKEESNGTKYIFSKSLTEEKKFAVGNNTDIMFNSSSPGKTLYFNIYDMAKGTPYTIESEVYIQNLGDRKIKDSTGT
jgi:prepilin-type N-terminal cleavage/methylation domain-containing protein